MLSFYNFIFEEVSTAEIEIQKNPFLTEGDKKDLNRLIHEFDNSEMSNDPEYFSLFKNKLFEKSIEQNLKDWQESNMILYVLRKTGKLIGFCTVRPNHVALKNTMLVHTLVISKNERSMGYGRHFLSYVLDDLKRNNPNKRVIINVFDQNPIAKKLYSSLGFRPGTIVMLKN